MPRSISSIQAEIDVIEARIASSDSLVRSAGSDGVSLNYEDRERLQKRLDQLYIQRDRANGSAPMIVRGHVNGLRGE